MPKKISESQWEYLVQMVKRIGFIFIAAGAWMTLTQVFGLTSRRMEWVEWWGPQTGLLIVVGVMLMGVAFYLLAHFWVGSDTYRRKFVDAAEPRFSPTPTQTYPTGWAPASGNATSVGEYFIREHVNRFLNVANRYDFFEVDSQEPAFACREPTIGLFSRLIRLTKLKVMTPFELVITDPQAMIRWKLRKGASWLFPRIALYNQNDMLVGYYKRQWNIKKPFVLLDSTGQQLGYIQREWGTFNYHIYQGDKNIATISQKWAGAAKEFFTTANNYRLLIHEPASSANLVQPFIIPAVLAIDQIFNEK